MIQRSEFLTSDECEQVAVVVDDLRPFWEKTSSHGRTYVLGAASYIHANGKKAGPEYHDRRRRLAPVMRERLGWMYARLTRALAAALGAPVTLADDLAPPGFHLYRWDPKLHLLRCSLHVDLQFESHDFTRYGDPDLAHPLSYTVAIRIPATGCGMNLWHKTREDSVRGGRDFRARLESSPPVNVRYGRGELTMHSGLYFHQIAPMQLSPGEMRLTLQGHAIRCGDTWQTYW